MSRAGKSILFRASYLLQIVSAGFEVLYRQGFLYQVKAGKGLTVKVGKKKRRNDTTRRRRFI